MAEINNKKAICILCRFPDEIHLEFWRKFSLTYKDLYDVYFIIDDENYFVSEYIKETYSNINLIVLKATEVLKCGYKQACYQTIKRKKVTSWDKAFYYFLESNRYKYLWFLEDDVFIPSIHTIPNIDNKHLDADLLCSPLIIKKPPLIVEDYPHAWREAINFNLLLPWARCMVSAVRISFNLQDKILESIGHYNRILFIELIIPTMAVKNNLKIETPAELETNIAVWQLRGKKGWKKADLNKNNIYHPVKIIPQHAIFRESLDLNE